MTRDDETVYSQTLTLAPVPEKVRRVYERRGMNPPEAETARASAATWPYLPRSLHRWYAHRFGHFWLPCPLCLRPFGGHEVTDGIPDPIGGANRYLGICPVCTAERNGGRP